MKAITLLLLMLGCLSCRKQWQKQVDFSGQGWQISKEEGRQIIRSVVRDTIILGKDPPIYNVSHSALIRLSRSGSRAGLIGRYLNDNECYRLIFEDEYLVLRRGEVKIGGGLFRAVPDTWYRLKFLMQDGLLLAYVDGELVFRLHDYKNGAPRLRAGKIGLYAEGEGVEFSDVTYSEAPSYRLRPLALPEFAENKYRKGITLNGIWEFSPESIKDSSLRVPDVWAGAAGYDDVRKATYERSFDLPEDFADHIQLEFEAVNDHAMVYLNDELIGEHKGKDVEFTMDAPSCSGRDNRLKIVVEELDEYHPHGWWQLGGGGQSNLGIRGNVWLKSYPLVHVKDVGITTSFRKKEIMLEIIIRNTGNQSRQVRVKNHILQSDGAPLWELPGDTVVCIKPGEETVISKTVPWDDPVLWFPDKPHLYQLKTTISEEGKTLDEYLERFGFREIWCEGPYLYLNGVRINLRGDSMVDHGSRISNTIYSDVIDLQQEAFYEFYFDRRKTEKIIDEILALNVNVIRTHMGPAPALFYEVCNEKGLMIIAETVCYGTMLHRDYGQGKGPDGLTLIENTDQWIKEYVHMLKNHPSVVMWSASNEAWPSIASDKPRPWDLYELTKILNRYDGTRPVVHHAGVSTACGFVHHYSTSHNSPYIPENLYQHREVKDRLIGEGEFFWVYDWSRYNEPDDDPASCNQWYKKVMGHGYLTRGYRYADYAYILPYRLNWAWKFSQYAGWDMEVQRDVLRKSMAAVAVFDKAYDDDYFDLQPHDLPELQENSTIGRTLIIYNDEYRDPEVQVSWFAQVHDEKVDSGTFPVAIEPGYHTEHSIDIGIPEGTAGSELLLVVESAKNGVTKYFDDSSYRFLVTESSE